jgi:hypothetical protein
MLMIETSGKSSSKAGWLQSEKELYSLYRNIGVDAISYDDKHGLFGLVLTNDSFVIKEVAPDAFKKRG